MANYRLKLIREIDALESFSEVWWQLWRADEKATPFQSPSWICSWVSHFPNYNLCFLLIYKRGELETLLPLVFDENDPSRLKLAGFGFSDYLDGLFENNMVGDGLRIAFESLTDHVGGLAMLDLTDLRAQSPLLSIGTWNRFQESVFSPYSACPTVLLDVSRDLEDQIPKGFAKRLGYSERRIGREFALEFRDCASLSCEALFYALCELQNRQWCGRQSEWLLGSSSNNGFHRDAFLRLASRGLAKIQLLYLDDYPVAGTYLLFAKGRCFYYVGCFDPEFSKYSVGSVMIAHSMRTAIRQGCRQFDFLRGEESYKYDWGAVYKPTFRRVLTFKAN